MWKASSCRPAAGGVTAPSGPQPYGALVAGGATVTRSFTFTATGACGADLTATLQLQDGSTNLGTTAFIFPLGAPATSPVVYSYTGPSVTIPDNNPTGVDVPLAVSGFV